MCFLRQTAGETSLILDEQHHPAVQSQLLASKALNTNCISLTSGTVGDHDDIHEESNEQTTLSITACGETILKYVSVNLS